MSQKSTKAQQGATIPVNFRFDGGLNYSESPSNIADNELARALNVIYNSQTGTPETRPGTACVTATALAHPIQKIYYYEKSAASKWLVAASYGKLYRLNTNAWVEIGSLTDTTTIPTFITFNTYLLIADGGTNLRKWDGTTYSSLSDGLKATAIAEIGGRVVINSKDDPDLVTFSGVEDETMWDTADPTNPAIGLRAGFGDNMAVNGLAFFGSDLIVSKRGASIKKLYRINTTGTPTEWTVNSLSINNCSQSPHTMVSAFNNIFFVDTNGFKSIKGVTEYGDLQVDTTGSRVNTQFQGESCKEVVYLPLFTAIWFLVSDRAYAYHRIAESNADGSVKYAFTDIQFGQGVINSIVQADDTIYLAGNNGYLYSISATSELDETAPTVYLAYPTVILTKRVIFPNGGLLKRTTIGMKAVGSSASTAYLKTADGVVLKTISVLTTEQPLETATGDLAIANVLLADIAGTAWNEQSGNRVRCTSLQYQIDSASGRFGVETLTAEVVLVEG